MYELIDRPVTDLDKGGRFLIWSMRSWVAATGARSCSVEALAPAFSKWRMLSGLQPFLRVMALLNRHGLDNFMFCALPCNHVSEHEAIIVSLLANCEHGPTVVQGTLDLLVEEEAVGATMVSLSQLHRAMEAAGIRPSPCVR
jgi:hypothetical protein